MIKKGDELMNFTRIHNAIQFAAIAHDGQYRKQSIIPYISHPYSVAMLLTAFSIEYLHQGKGFAKKAMKDLKTFVMKEFSFCNEIVLAVNKRNVPAQNLYKKAGFTDTGRRKMGKIGEQLILSLSIS